MPLADRRTFIRFSALAAGVGAAGVGTVAASTALADRAAQPAPKPPTPVELTPSFGAKSFQETKPGAGGRAKAGGPNLQEASGIVASRRHPGVFWIIRDSAGDPYNYRRAIYAVRFDARAGRLLRWGASVRQTSCDGYLKHVFVYDRSGALVRNTDIEDVAYEIGTTPARNRIWFGNIGNNGHHARSMQLFRCPEPNPFTDTKVTVEGQVTFWSRKNHRAPQVNSEALFVAHGVPHVLVKTAPSDCELQQGHILRIDPRLGGTLDAVPVAMLKSPSKQTSFKPTGADFRQGGLLLCRANGWLRYDASNPRLRGDALMRDIAARPAGAMGYWRPDETLAAVEASAWIPGTPDGVLSVSETGTFRWLRSARG